MEINGYEIEILPNELILNETPIQGYKISSGKNIIAGVCTEISEELDHEEIQTTLSIAKDTLTYRKDPKPT